MELRNIYVRLPSVHSGSDEWIQLGAIARIYAHGNPAQSVIELLNGTTTVTKGTPEEVMESIRGRIG